MKYYTVNTVQKAWNLASDLFKGDYEYNPTASERAGYPIYMSTNKASNDHVSDLGCRLEVNVGAESINIWIEEPEEETAEQETEQTTEQEEKPENTYAISIKVNFKKSGTVLKGFTAFTEEHYMFYAYEEQEAIKAADAIMKYLKKHDGYVYISVYDSKFIEAGNKYLLFVDSNWLTRDTGTVRIGTYINGNQNNYDHRAEERYSFTAAARKMKEVITEGFIKGTGIF